MKIFLKTYGCQMNERDSEEAESLLTAAGHRMVLSEKDADVILLNTCSVRDQAERKAIGKTGIMKELTAGKQVWFGIMGCMAQSRGEELLKTISHLNFAVGTDQIHRLPEIVEKLTPGCKILCVEQDTVNDAAGLGSHCLRGNFKAYITVMRGCNRFCTYCIVPYVRGRERSRSPEAILEEARALADNGVREIMLLGQNVAAYGLENGRFPKEGESPFADLLDRLSEIPGLARIRFTSPHPAFFNDRLIDCIAANPKVCKSIHLPLQSGSDRILKKMNRPYTCQEYLSIIERLRRKCGEGNIAFSTDVIVGFPGETEEDFLCTKQVMEQVRYDLAFIFKYSPRKGTKSSLMPDDVPTEIKEERNQILLQVLEKSSEEGNRYFEGKTLEVLAEGPSKRNPARWSGRTDCSKLAVFTPAPGLKPGDLVKVRITRSTPLTLFGELI